MPQRYSLPSEMGEAVLLVETNWTQDQLDDCPENLLNNILLYKAIKQILQNGGELNFGK